MLLDYLFCDEETGEAFFVETDAGKDEAMAMAKQYFDNPRLMDIYDPEYAEELGYDTY